MGFHRFTGAAAVAAGAACAGLSAAAAVVTNDFFGDVTSPTTLRGVTNIVAKCAPVNISADLTLDERTFLWLRGESEGSPAWVNLAPTAADATLTVRGHSGFFTAYRYSMDGSNANNEWGRTGIDLPKGEGNADGKASPPGYYRVRMGVPDGAPGSTGQARIVLETDPKFGYNAFSGFWARYLDIETSVSPNPETGTIDFLEIPANVRADISQIQNKSTRYPARILFGGGTLLRNNMTVLRDDSAPLSPAPGATLILEGVDGADIRLKAQFRWAPFTGRKGGTVRIVGRHVYLTQSGSTPPGVSGANHQPWCLDADDRVVWELTGNLLLNENVYLRTTSDDLLPHGPSTGILKLGYNSGVKEAAAAAGTVVPSCWLDLCGTRQRVNGLTSTGAEAWRRGVVTNSAAATGTLVLGADDLGGALNATCTAGVTVEKAGTGLLTIERTSGETLDVRAGRVVFAAESVFTNVTAAAGTTLDGEATVLGAFEAKGAVAAHALHLALAAGARVTAAAPLAVHTLTVGGAAVARGTYTPETAAWVASGAVTVLWRAGDAVADVVWTGEGETAAADLAANWSRAADFSTLGARPVFAAAGASARLDGVYNFSGLFFDAPGDFTLAAGAAGAARLYGNLDLAAAPAGETRTYTVAAPLALASDQTLTLPTNVALRLTGGLSGAATGGLEMVGAKLSDQVWDYADQGGGLVLENARISGPITHTRGGGWLVLRGDVGCPGDTAALVLDYCRLRDDKTWPANASDTARFALTGNTRVEGATIYKPVQISGRGQIGNGCANWFIGAADTVNVFKEAVTCGSSMTFRLGEGGTFVFEKGVTVSGGGLGLCPEGAAGRHLYVLEGPVALNSGWRTFTAGATSNVVFRCTGSSVRHFVEIGSGALSFEADDAFTDTGFSFTVKDKDALCGALALGGTHQRLKWLSSGEMVRDAQNNPQAGGGQLWGVVRGDGATLEIAPGVPAGHEAVTNCGAQVTGRVTLAKSGAGVHRMLARAYESCGDVEVSGGRLVFDAGATWRNGTNVVVRGTGTLALGAGGTFRDDVCVTAEGGGWTLELTGVQKAESLVVDGVSMPGGDYGAAHAKLGAHFKGTGVLRVRRIGSVLLFR